MGWYWRLYRPGLATALVGASAVFLLAPSFPAARADTWPTQGSQNPLRAVVCPRVSGCAHAALVRAAADTAPAYVPVFQPPSEKAELRQRPSRFTVTLEPVLGASYDVTDAHWQGWGTNRTDARVSGRITCNQQGPCGRFRAEVTLTGIRTDSTCHVRVYSHMQMGQITDATTGKLLRAGGPGYIPTTWSCPTPALAQPKPGTGVLAIPIAATSQRRFSGTVALFSYPLSGAHELTADRFRAEVSWGDRQRSRGTTRLLHLGVVDSILERSTGRAFYYVSASHIYRKPSQPTTRITIRDPAGRAQSAAAHATVSPADPIAAIFLNPDNPSSGDVALVVPGRPGPFQRPIETYIWSFSDGLPVIDDKATRPVYMAVLRALSKNPSDLGALGWPISTASCRQP